MKEKLYVILFTIALCAAAGVLLTFANSQLKGFIEQNREREVYENVLAVFGIEVEEGATFEQLNETFDRQIDKVKVDGYIYYEGYKSEGKRAADLIGYAFEVVGPGFWGKIKGFMAVAPDKETIIGVSLYEHEETPGLGGRIHDDPAPPAPFELQFVGKKIYPEGTVDKTAENVWVVISPSTGLEKPQNEVDAITGASETSRAVERFLNKCIRDFVEAQSR